MNNLPPITFFILLSACNVKQSNDQLQKQKDSLELIQSKKIEGPVQLQHTLVHELTSVFTKTDYDVYISFPRGYDSAKGKFPVLVVLDAEVNFGAMTYIAQRLAKDELIPPLFVVGIAYRGETDEDTHYAIRGRDLTPTTDPEKQYRFGNGGAENFVKFISDELFPYLLANYPIQNDNKALYGHSFGGLFGTHVLLNHPTLFNNYLILSPSLWWNKKAIMTDVELDSSITRQHLKVYMATGALEGGMVGDQLKMVKTILALNSKNINIKSEILDNETHRTVIGRGFTNALRFVYSKN
jgi:predicted alpha/beta superfamily hydrolase